MAEKLMVVLNKGDHLSHGITLLNVPGEKQHVVYEIVENSPAAENGMVEAGDVIVKVNGTDVESFSSRELLKFLRISKDPVTIELKRDKHINAEFKKAKLENQNDKDNKYQSKIPNLNINNRNLSSEQQQSTSSNKISPSKSSKIARLNSNSSSQRTESPKIETTTPQKIEVAMQYNETTTNTSINYSNNQRLDNIQRTPNSEPITRRSRIPQVIKSPGHQPTTPLSSHSYNNQRHCRSAELVKTDYKKSYSNVDNHNTGSLFGNNHNEASPPKARFEAYMMTGDLILNLSRTPQSTGLINSQNNNEKNDSKRRNGSIIAPYAKYDSSPSPPSTSEKSDKENYQNNTEENNKNDINVKKVTSANTNSDTTTTSSHFNSTDLVDYISESNLNKTLKNCDSISSSSSTVRGDVNSSEISFSVPTSPTSVSIPLIEQNSGNSGYLIKKKETSNSVPTSPECGGAQEFNRRTNQQHNCVVRTCDAAGFRTSRSEDHLQATQRDGLGAAIPIDIEEDVNSSLNTLLDTRHDSDETQESDKDRIVWTYNAPINLYSHGGDNSSQSSSSNSSPQRSDSPASPTSVSSSVMSSNSSSKGNNGLNGMHNLMYTMNGDQSVSEALSNISSPDYKDDDNLLSSRDIAMAISDPSDSDSTILVSEAHHHISDKEKLFQQVNCNNKDNNNYPVKHGYSELKDSEDELATLTDDPPTILLGQEGRDNSPPISDDGSDVESLHSYHYSPKAVDIPSAIRLAKRLYSLDGFKKSDVSRHLSKNNDFSRAVAEEYLKYFNFDKISLDEALRQFLQQFSLSGETQERERVLVHFSRRYLDCNPNCFNSQDAVHTLTCAIMLLNTDLHGQNIGRRMTCSEFIENLSELNDGENFPKDVLKYLYQAIKNNPLQWALDEDYPVPRKSSNENSLQGPPVGPNPFLENIQNVGAIEYKKGYVMRKCCYDSNNKKTPFGKRSWKMFYCTLRDLVLYLHKDEHGFRKNQMSDNVHNAIRIHHALATKALDYTKKQHVFRLQTSDQAEYLFQTSDSKELQSWIDTINLVCASFSAPPLEGGVGSQKRFQRPLLPSTHTKLLLKEQLENHEQRVVELSTELEKHRNSIIPSKGLALQNYKEKDAYLQYELKRYKAYVSVLGPKVEEGDQSIEFFNRKQNEELILTGQRNNPIMSSPSQLNSTGLTSAGAVINELDVTNQDGAVTSNRYSYRAAIYRSDAQHDLG